MLTTGCLGIPHVVHSVFVNSENGFLQGVSVMKCNCFSFSNTSKLKEFRIPLHAGITPGFCKALFCVSSSWNIFPVEN